MPYLIDYHSIGLHFLQACTRAHGNWLKDQGSLKFKHRIRSHFCTPSDIHDYMYWTRSTIVNDTFVFSHILYCTKGRTLSNSRHEKQNSYNSAPISFPISLKQIFANCRASTSTAFSKLDDDGVEPGVVLVGFRPVIESGGVRGLLKVDVEEGNTQADGELLGTVAISYSRV